MQNSVFNRDRRKDRFSSDSIWVFCSFPFKTKPRSGGGLFADSLPGARIRCTGHVRLIIGKGDRKSIQPPLGRESIHQLEENESVLTSHCSAIQELLATDLVISNHDQVTRMAPELAPSSPNYDTTPTGGRLSSRQI
ncbi:hypothetical protein TNCV_1728091 [Trichonephila clavipes]|nr:hypothetical protein TNCV_1728091 [Trichonephila clavipes]